MSAVATGSFLICIGMNACSQAAGQSCSIALGDNVQFPAGQSSHVMATTSGTRPLYHIDAELKQRTNAEIGLMCAKDESVRAVLKTNSQGRCAAVLGDDYIGQWNKACGR